MDCMHNFSCTVNNIVEVIYVNDREKKKRKNSVFNAKTAYAVGSVAAVMIVMGTVMNFAIPKPKKKDIDVAEKVQESAKIIDDYNQHAASVATDSKPKQEKEEKNETSQNNEDTGETTARLALSFPVDGAITKDYSGDELVYSDTLEDWRTHNGIDIYAEEGSEVKASADGVVDAVADNGMFGRTVIVLHSGGLRTIYSNLAEADVVSVGDEVKTGGCIGRVGATAAAEAAEKPHLHFEVSLNEQTVSPYDYLPANDFADTE